MSFNPNQLLNNPASLLALKSQTGSKVSEAPIPAPSYNKALYENAYSRLGMLNIANVADLGCGAGNFTGVMVDRRQRPEVYLGIDSSHNLISVAKAAYPGWNFIYGDFTKPQVFREYERYEAYLMLNLLDEIEDDLGLVAMLPSEKAVLFSMPRFPREGSLRFIADGPSLRERYSSLIAIKSVGSFQNDEGAFSMVVGKRW